MIDNRLGLMCGVDIPIPQCQIAIHQPRIREIAMMGEKEYFIGAQVLCIDKSMYSEDESLLSETTNFQIFMTIMFEKEVADKKAIVMQLLNVLLPNHQVALTPRSIILKDRKVADAPTIIIDESNFDFLQETLRDIFCFNSSNMSHDSYNPQGDKAKEIAAKLMRGRQRIAAEKGEDNASSLVQYTSVLTIGLNSMSLKDVTDLTMYQLYDLVQRYMLWVNWDLDVRTRLAGGSPDSSPDNWMKNIH